MAYLAPFVGQLEANGNPAFHANPSKRAMVMVPIAAHQEPTEYVGQTLSLLHRQMAMSGSPVFGVVLSCNYPDVRNGQYYWHVRRNLEVIEAFRTNRQTQQLPLSYFSHAYPPQTTIGRIRKDLWDATITVLNDQYHGDLPPRIAMFNTDVDTSKLSNPYISRLYQAIEEGASYAAANKRYARSRGQFPNLDQVVAMYDLGRMSPYQSYDCHNALALETYLESEGFSPSEVTHETHRMRERAQVTMGNRFNQPLPVQVAGAIAVSPPRRPYAVYRRGGTNNLWEDGQFGMQDAYRARTNAQASDISPQQAAQLIEETTGIMLTKGVDEWARYFVISQKLPHRVAEEKAREKIRRIVHVAYIRFGLQALPLNPQDYGV